MVFGKNQRRADTKADSCGSCPLVRGEDNEMTIREQVEWYLDRIIDRMTQEDAEAILALLNRIATRAGGKC